MSRRRTIARTRIVWLDWTPAVAGLFGLVPKEWAPPLQVKVVGGLKRSTWSARFTAPDGSVTTARVRLRHCPHSGDQVVVEETLEQTFRFELGPT